ncbi:UNC93-like protein 1 [Hibiscus syriacus]|uniref:UNC93-like protein 1 n=1 Tax=Hibiscus syriacus TaxID=106335 RepID=A0A6A2YZY7_HIBSY|nr:UNC93-like protein 1 [Hibiscus syriacus]XP_039021969.1 UNC93-like protein 1 [Hibiscus syriacus]XP_039021970.1 UNC93-like protein 1 [Hibiscus syriacus]KAE8684769.1 UNC93-like protein 1 [Hibiscus syriacus]
MGIGDRVKDEESVTELTAKSRFRYNSPLVQVVLIGLVCFCCPGMFNALSGMGGGGQVDPTAANNANTALYTTFALFGVLGGGIYNILGPHLTLAAGCCTYVLYAGSFLYYNHHQHQGFAIAAGALLGIGAGLLWAGEGAIMTAYPPSNRKGSYISLFWSIFNMGGVIGGLIPFILNYHRNEAASVNDATYIAFMCFMTAGTLLSFAILPPNRVVRDDGTRCTNVKYSSVATEATEVLKLFANWKMLLIVPAAWASNFFYSYQFNNVNGLLFNLRTRGLNNVFYWGAQMLGSVGIGYILDFSFRSRRMRGFIGIGVVALVGSAIWGGGLANQLPYSHDDLPKKLDFRDSAFAGPFVLYFSYGLLDAMFQSMVYWVIGALADDSQTLSRYSGFYKGVQSAGAAVAWQVDSHKVPLLSQLIVNWSLTTISYPLLVLLVMLAVKDDKSEDEIVKEEAAVPSSNKDVTTTAIST